MPPHPPRLTVSRIRRPDLFPSRSSLAAFAVLADIEGQSVRGLISLSTVSNSAKKFWKPQRERAKVLLEKHQAALQSLSQSLLTHESLDGSAIQEVLGASPGLFDFHSVSIFVPPFWCLRRSHAMIGARVIHTSRLARLHGGR